MGSYLSKFVKCPYYRNDETQVIYCEGVEEAATTHVAFGSRNKARDYKKDFCCNRWPECRIAQMLNAKYEEN